MSFALRVEFIVEALMLDVPCKTRLESERSEIAITSLSQATLNTLQFFSFLTMSSCQFVFKVVRSIGRLVIAKRCKLHVRMYVCPKSVCGRNYIPINEGGKKLL